MKHERKYETLAEESKITGLSINRLKAINILETIAEEFGNPWLFDNEYAEEGKEPDGTWYDYEDLVTELLDNIK